LRDAVRAGALGVPLLRVVRRVLDRDHALSALRFNGTDELDEVRLVAGDRGARCADGRCVRYRVVAASYTAMPRIVMRATRGLGHAHDARGVRPATMVLAAMSAEGYRGNAEQDGECRKETLDAKATSYSLSAARRTTPDAPTWGPRPSTSGAAFKAGQARALAMRREGCFLELARNACSHSVPSRKYDQANG
jgi:hypothetical protein